MNYLILIIVGIAGVVIGRQLSHKRNLISEQGKRKEENKKQILGFMQNPNPADGQARKITNNDIEKLLGVSDSTAQRYLQELEKEQKIRQIGETGQSVYYVLK